ncbi:MAG: hypothetical protein EXQ87_03910 [Alphaproteobacteria bacterium]|nr:hypothetical protein [Alphaproteobacteria bacterium]
MQITWGRAVLAALTAGLFWAVAPDTAEAANKKEAPACAQISFRPLVPGAPDGEQAAGLYKSRFGKIEVKANVKGGEAQDYFMTINGKRPAAFGGPLPKHVETCLKAKHVVVPVKSQTGACLGGRFRVVVDRSAAPHLAMFFGLKGKEWHLCSATQV